MSNKQKLTSNEQNLMCNKQKLTSNEQRAKGFHITKQKGKTCRINFITFFVIVAKKNLLFYYYFTIAIMILVASWNVMVKKYVLEFHSNYPGETTAPSLSFPTKYEDLQNKTIGFVKVSLSSLTLFIVYISHFEERWNFLLVFRYFFLIASYFLLVASYIFLVARYFLLVARYFLLAARCFLLFACYSARLSLLLVGCSLL